MLVDLVIIISIKYQRKPIYVGGMFQARAKFCNVKGPTGKYLTMIEGNLVI